MREIRQFIQGLWANKLDLKSYSSFNHDAVLNRRIRKSQKEVGKETKGEGQEKLR